MYRRGSQAPKRGWLPYRVGAYVKRQEGGEEWSICTQADIQRRDEGGEGRITGEGHHRQTLGAGQQTSQTDAGCRRSEVQGKSTPWMSLEWKERGEKLAESCSSNWNLL